MSEIETLVRSAATDFAPEDLLARLDARRRAINLETLNAER